MPAPLVISGLSASARLAVKKFAENQLKKAGAQGGTKVGQTVGKKISESTKAPKYPSAQGKTISSKVQGKVSTTSKSGRTTSKAAESVKYTKKPATQNQRLGSFKAQDTKRTKAIVSGADTARKAAAPIIGKEVLKKRTYKGIAAVAVADSAYQRNKNKKKNGK
jgi:hypothetical protein